jgi:hypothetical protein
VQASTRASAGERRRAHVERVRVRVLPDGRLSRRNAALYLGCSSRTLEGWNYAGKGPTPHTVGGRVFYYLRDLDAFIAGAATDRGAAKGFVAGSAATG